MYTGITFVCVLKKAVGLLCYCSSLAFGTKFYILLGQIFWGMFNFALKTFKCNISVCCSEVQTK